MCVNMCWILIIFLFSFCFVLCRWNFTVKKEEMNKILEEFGGDLSLPENFERTAPIHDPNQPKKKSGPPSLVINPQTSLLCTMLDLTGQIITHKIVLKRFKNSEAMLSYSPFQYGYKINQSILKTDATVPENIKLLSLA